MNTENIDTELSLLFLLFKNRSEALKVFDNCGFKDKYFSVETHRLVYNIYTKLLRDGQAMSVQGFLNYYKATFAKNEKDTLMVRECLSILKNHICTLKDVNLYVKIMRNLYGVRVLLSNMDDTVEGELDKDLENRLDKLGNTIDDIKREMTPTDNIIRVLGLREGLTTRYDYLKDVHDNPEKLGLIETGLVNIDKFIGKMHGGDLFLYQSRTNMGKSMFLMHTGVHNWLIGRKVIVITIEMSAMQWLFRIDSKVSKYEHKEFKTGTLVESPEFINKWQTTIKDVKNPDDLLCYWVPSDCTPQKLFNIVKNNPFKPDLVIIDYAGDMVSGIKGLQQYDAGAQGEVFKSLKEVAGEFDCVVASAQQIKRGVKNADTESGSWSDVAAFKADTIAVIECTNEDKDYMTQIDGIVYNGRLTIRTTKVRSGPKCKTHIIPVFNRMDFIEKENEDMIGTEFTKSKTNKRQNKENVDELDNKLTKTPKNVKNDYNDIKFDENELNLLD